MHGLIPRGKKEKSLQKNLFLQVRFTLSSMPALKTDLGTTSYFYTTKEGILLKKEIEQDNAGFYGNKPIGYFTSRLSSYYISPTKHNLKVD